MTIRAYLVDLDGTLVDTEIANAKAYSAALAECGIEVDFDYLLKESKGKNWRQFLPKILAEHTHADLDPEKIANRKKFLYKSSLNHSAVNQALVELLDSSKNVLKLCLVTTASSENAHAVLKHHNLTGLFSLIITGDDVLKHKPDPEAYLLALSKLNLRPDECLAFEDSPIGMKSARSAGIQAIGISLPRFLQ